MVRFKVFAVTLCFLSLFTIFAGCTGGAPSQPTPASAPSTEPTPTPVPTTTPLPPPADFEVISLDIKPPEVTTGETVSITAEVKNTGDGEGTYTAVLTVDGVKFETKDV